MKNKDNNNTNNSVGSGFLLGFILGILATLLLTTKKGREILKELLDKGIQKISGLEESLEKTKQEKMQPEEEGDYIKQDPGEVKKVINHLLAEKLPEKGIREEKSKNGLSSHAAARRLFFRKSAKKSL
ncbi:YtxH domain-containing protein [Patescibacteria group bacterium]|nr:YtxH domain-containing protein [Patescibacteria group bacterium]MBU4016120.1 YtxH domain-containing protein [Patescibacteria group bacterium]MBU4098088.1 YtxH domain-containing protein [Patescibacteria group bacterium]